MKASQPVWAFLIRGLYKDSPDLPLSLAMSHDLTMVVILATTAGLQVRGGVTFRRRARLHEYKADGEVTLNLDRFELNINSAFRLLRAHFLLSAEPC
jgi:hypothetical protein